MSIPQATARCIRLALISAGLLLGSGCATVHPTDATGTGVYSYISGWMTWTYPTDLHATWTATLQAVERLQLRIQTKTQDGLGGRIEALRADQTKVEVRLKPVSTRTTDVSVHVGTFGDRQVSEDIHQAIRVALKL